jgi:membrane protein
MAIPRVFLPFQSAFQEFRDEDAPQRAAALSFYAVTAIPPLVVLLTAILGLVYSGPQAGQELVNQVGSLFGQETAETVSEILQRRASASNGWAALGGLLVMLLGASGFFVELQKALNHVWGVQPDPQAGWKQTLLKRFLSMTVVLGTGFLLLISLMVSTFIAVAGRWLELRLGWSVGLASLAEALVGLAMITAMFSLLFYYLPDARVSWSDAWRGALATAVLFLIGKFALGWYLGRSDFTADYGSAGALVLILFWVYYSSMILLFGAELTQAQASARGHAAEPERYAVKLPRVRRRLTVTSLPDSDSDPSPAAAPGQALA